MARLPRKVTYSDLQRLPEDGPRYELYDGEVWEMPSPTMRHQKTAFKVARLLDDYADRVGGASAISPIDIVFSEYDVVQPDVVFWVPARAGLVEMDVANRARPDLAVEVFSPSTARNDRGRKLQMFARYGVPEYWLLDPETRALEVRSLRDGDYALVLTAGCGETVASPLMPDLVVQVSTLFVDC